MQCQVCQESKTVSYKCPKCRIRYCSVACFQKHTASERCVEGTPQSQPTVEGECDVAVRENSNRIGTVEIAPMTQMQLPIELGDNEESDRLPAHVLERIGDSSEVLQLLKNQHLQAMIKTLDRSTNPADDMQTAMVEPIFVQFVDALLKIVENKDIP